MYTRETMLAMSYPSAIASSPVFRLVLELFDFGTRLAHLPSIEPRTAVLRSHS